MMHSIAQHLIGGFEGKRITPTVKTLIQKHRLGGFILFRRNIQSPAQVKGLISRLQDLSTTPLWMGVDQEGGRVFRLGPPFTQTPPMADLGRLYRKTKDLNLITQVGQILGRELKVLGFNWDYAPVVDVHSNPKNPIIADRSFSPDPKIVSKCAAALIKGLHSEGILSCAKHFPGHGSTSADSHKELPIVRSQGRLLWKRDLLPYRQLIKQKLIPTIMTAHVLYPTYDKDNCATLSPTILSGILRKRLGYQGLIVSDDFFMKAIADNIGIEEAVYRFFKAGGDIALLCHQPKVQLKVITYLKKKLSKDKALQKHLARSYRRIQKLQKLFCNPISNNSLATIGCSEHQKIIRRIK